MHDHRVGAPTCDVMYTKSWAALCDIGILLYLLSTVSDVFDWEVLLESVVGLQSRNAGILHLRLRLLGMQEALLWRLGLLRGGRLG